jgi:glycogen operon protein
LSASADIFNRRGRKPWASVNFVTAHDGFTMNDLVSYNEKHNEANGEDGKDGTSDNRSWNCGVEGPTEDPEINRLREKQMRNMFATLLLAQGLPMILAGDEFHRTQGGNNNAYALDNNVSWVDWSLAQAHKDTIDFVRSLIELRNRYAVLRRNRFLTGAYNEALGVKDVTWLQASGAEMTEEAWTDPRIRCIGMLLDGRAQATGVRERGSDATMLLVLNSHHEEVKLVFPAAIDGQGWRLELDTSDSVQVDRVFKPGEMVEMYGRSVRLYAMC